MSARLRFSPWGEDRLPLESVTSELAPHVDRAASSPSRVPVAWCDDATLASQWTLAACDPVAERATFAQSAAPDGERDGAAVRCQVVDSDANAQQRGAVHGGLIDAQVAVASVVCIVVIVVLLRKLREERQSGGSSRPADERSKAHRCEELDIFRGLTICLMIFVNYGGGGLALFQHSVWDGLTIADVVFPCFAWIMGFTMHLATTSSNSTTSWGRVVTRAAKLCALGLFLNNGTSWADWRIPGVLQSLGAAYLVVSCLTRLAESALATRPHLNRSSIAVAHVVGGIAPLVATNVSLTFGLQAPGCPRGYVGPGGDSDGGRFRGCTGGAHLYVDRVVFGMRHIYQTPTCQPAFHTGPFDPEGLLNWLMVAATAYFGFVTGILFNASKGTSSTQPAVQLCVYIGIALLLASSVLTGAFGGFPHYVWIPLNKNLWSLSYVLVSAGVATMTFAALLLCGRHPPAARWLPSATWACVGRNSIFLYIMHEILQAYAPFAAPPWASAAATVPSLVLLLHNVTGVLWWVYIAEWMHTRGIQLAV